MNFTASALYGVSVATLLALVLGFLRGGLDAVSATMALSGGFITAASTLWNRRSRTESSVPAPGPWEWAAIVTFTLVTLRIFLWVVFIDGDEIRVLSPNNLGDLSLHLTYIRYLANGAPFWPENPIAAGPLTYPLGVDLFHSLLTLVGVDIWRGFVWIGLTGSALTGAALWRWGRGVALFGFLGNGGLFGLGLIFTGQLADYQAEFAWKSFALSLLATQRGLLFALPAGLLLLASWRTRFFQAGDTRQRLPLAGEVLLYAALPFFHFHTFLFLSVLLAVWFVLQPSARRELLQLVGISFVPATALVWFITGGLKGGRMLGWKAGWMWDDTGFLAWCGEHLGEPERLYAALTFWPLNFGVLPLLVAALLFVLIRRKYQVWPLAIVVPALGVFLICCFVKFAPWEWDNTKLMVWSYLALLPFLWSELIARRSFWIRAAAAIVLFGSGFVSTLGGIDAEHRGYAIATRAELDGVGYAVASLPVTERFAGAPTYNHPLLLNGRKMVLGYLGHVASHGLEWQDRNAELTSLMQGEEGWEERATRLGVRYLFWGAPEDHDYADSPQPWRETKQVVATGDWGTIYDLQTAAASEKTSPSGLPSVAE